MRHTRAKSLALTACLFLFLLSVTRAQVSDPRSRAVPAGAPEISYTVSMARPQTHLFEVEARLSYRGAAPASLDLVMPVWTPGSYLVREFERHVQEFDARDGGGKTLNWTKTDKDTWRVEAAGAREVRVRYAVFANELSVRTADLNDRHAFWNNANLLMYPDGFLGAPATVKVEPFGDWKIATTLPAANGAPNTFRAEDFDILYDSPFLVSNFKTISFEVRGVPHRIVIDGEGNYDPERLRRDVPRILETEVEMMGEMPHRDYTFFLLLGPARSGLEHLNSASLTQRRFGFGTQSELLDFYSDLISHEYFHLWNVKRIRPDALGPFDYTRENYTRLLWVAEGVTTYYEDRFLQRAGLMNDRQYLQLMAGEMQKLQQTPGRLLQSLEEASFDAWIEYYRPDEQTINSAVSYYDKGAVVGLLLDLEIRGRSGGARSLDDVMRALYKDFFKQGRNYTPEDFQREAERAAGASLEEFFRRFVRGREELDYDAALAWAGLRLDTTSDAAGRPAPAVADLGATLEEKDGRLTVRNVPAGTAAYEQGLSAADQIVAVDGYRATLAFLNQRISDKRPGEQLTLTVFRGDELRTLSFKLGAHTAAAYRILPRPDATEQQRRNYQAWLGAPFPK
ncbi:MAG: M61 family metallopeptidase [Acidobacteria bacterium]|nr:M61 family metallopeptidase [Acidobacteriota bacterium]